jgi:hypothetical protein
MNRGRPRGNFEKWGELIKVEAFSEALEFPRQAELFFLHKGCGGQVRGGHKSGDQSF